MTGSVEIILGAPHEQPMSQAQQDCRSSVIGIANCLLMLESEARELGLSLAASLIGAASLAVSESAEGHAWIPRLRS